MLIYKDLTLFSSNFLTKIHLFKCMLKEIKMNVSIGVVSLFTHLFCYLQNMPALVDKSKFLIIRLARWGCTNRPFYHIVVTKNRMPRNSGPIELLGTFDPMRNQNGELLCSINYQRLIFFLSINTKLSKSAAQLIGK